MLLFRIITTATKLFLDSTSFIFRLPYPSPEHPKCSKQCKNHRSGLIPDTTRVSSSKVVAIFREKPHSFAQLLELRKGACVFVAFCARFTRFVSMIFRLKSVVFSFKTKHTILEVQGQSLENVRPTLYSSLILIKVSKRSFRLTPCFLRFCAN